MAQTLGKDLLQALFGAFGDEGLPPAKRQATGESSSPFSSEEAPNGTIPYLPDLVVENILMRLSPSELKDASIAVPQFREFLNESNPASRRFRRQYRNRPEYIFSEYRDEFAKVFMEEEANELYLKIISFYLETKKKTPDFRLSKENEILLEYLVFHIGFLLCHDDELDFDLGEPMEVFYAILLMFRDASKETQLRVSEWDIASYSLESIRMARRADARRVRELFQDPSFRGLLLGIFQQRFNLIPASGPDEYHTLFYKETPYIFRQDAKMYQIRNEVLVEIPF